MIVHALFVRVHSLRVPGRVIEHDTASSNQRQTNVGVVGRNVNMVTRVLVVRAHILRTRGRVAEHDTSSSQTNAGVDGQDANIVMYVLFV